MSPDRKPFSPENEERIRSIIKPGDLIWGTGRESKELVSSLLTNGIQPPCLHGKPHALTNRYRSICLAMMSTAPKESDIQRYLHEQHLGPTQSHMLGFAIIVSRTKLLLDIPTQITATGIKFKSTRYQDSYEYSAHEQTVFSIPIGNATEYMDPFVSEVEITHDTNSHFMGITPRYWTGIVSGDQLAGTLREWLLEKNLSIPVLTLPK